MMVFYHFGIGTDFIAAGLSKNLTVLSSSLALIGVFAAIYRLVGIAMLLSKNQRTGFRLRINGVFGKMGIAISPYAISTILL